MELRWLNDTDYDEILVDWWKDWKWEAPPKDMLPQDGKGGLIVYDGDTPVVAGFLYMTNSKTAWIEFIVSNFKYRGKRKEAIILLINQLSEIAKMNNIKYIYTSLKSKSLIDKYEECGFIKGDSNCQEMIKIWQQ